MFLIYFPKKKKTVFRSLPVYALLFAVLELIKLSNKGAIKKKNCTKKPVIVIRNESPQMNHIPVLRW